jgi:hypothetical protein
MIVVQFLYGLGCALLAGSLFDALLKRTWSIVLWSDVSDAIFSPSKTITFFWRRFSARYFRRGNGGFVLRASFVHGK